jgi:hypothetical protein
LLQEQSALHETRAYRVSGGGGTRIGRIYVGGGMSESHQRLRAIDSGTLVLTNQRLVFDGASESRTIKLDDYVCYSLARRNRGKLQPTPEKSNLPSHKPIPLGFSDRELRQGYYKNHQTTRFLSWRDIAHHLCEGTAPLWVGIKLCRRNETANRCENNCKQR